MGASNTTFGIANVVPLNLSVSGGDITLSPTQSAILYIILSGALTGDFNLTFPLLGVWQVDTSQIVFNGFNVNISNGTNTGKITTASICAVSIPSANNVVILQPSPSQGNCTEISFDFTTANSSSPNMIPAGASIWYVSVDIENEYDNSATVLVGNASSPTALMGASDSVLATPSKYEISADTNWIADAPVLVSILGSPTVGSGSCIVRYSV